MKSILYLECIKDLLCACVHHLEPEKILISLVNFLQVLLVLDLQLVEINLMEYLPHFLFLKSKIFFVCMNLYLTSQSTAKVMSGPCLHFMGLLPKMRMS